MCTDYPLFFFSLSLSRQLASNLSTPTNLFHSICERMRLILEMGTVQLQFGWVFYKEKKNQIGNRTNVIFSEYWFRCVLFLGRENYWHRHRHYTLYVSMFSFLSTISFHSKIEMKPTHIHVHTLYQITPSSTTSAQSPSHPHNYPHTYIIRFKQTRTYACTKQHFWPILLPLSLPLENKKKSSYALHNKKLLRQSIIEDE